MGHAPMSTPNATRAPCPVLRQCVSRSRSTPTRLDAWRSGTTPHDAPARPVKQVFGGRRPLRAPAGATTMPQASPETTRRLSAWGTARP